MNLPTLDLTDLALNLKGGKTQPSLRLDAPHPYTHAASIL
jgi:hypothetical protein